MEAYINASSCISHYPTIDETFFFGDSPAIPASNFLFVTPPNYKDYIPAQAIRRSSHILKMGVSAGLMCLSRNQEAALPVDAIITGTAMGCYEDTDKFLRSIGDNGEKMLTPTSFIQSTHNTVAGQLALQIKCHGYNFTYVHQGLSFEYALADALLLLKEGEADHVLTGGTDELIPPLCALFERAGHIKALSDLNQALPESSSPGYVAGEGAAFFHLGREARQKDSVKIRGLRTYQQIRHADELKEHTQRFLEEAGLSISEISLILSGINGDPEQDRILNEFSRTSQLPAACFKHLCGEYFTSSAFALWFATRILQRQEIPASALFTPQAPGKLSHILIVNHFQGLYSMICVSL